VLYFLSGDDGLGIDFILSKLFFMIQVKLTLVKEDNYDSYFLGLYEVETLPRAGEYIFYTSESRKGGINYRVKSVIHILKPEPSTELLIVSIE
jgi:hypothetical protein